MAIFIPKKIKVGCQDRDGTYTGKLAYVIYYDARGKLRKETSWKSWCSHYGRKKTWYQEDFDNVPTEGFVLNKKVGGYSDGWDHRQTYARVYDPRGFEFEIDICNLLYILENTNCIKGKGLEGKFVYGWDGGDLVLIPEAAPEYVGLQELADLQVGTQSIKGKDLILGATYKANDNGDYIYLGRFDYHKLGYQRVTETGEYGYVSINKGKHYFFIYTESGSDYYLITKSLTKRILKVVSDTCVGNYAELMDALDHRTEYSPYDSSKDEYVEADPSRLKSGDTVYFTDGGTNFKSQVYSWGSSTKSPLCLYRIGEIKGTNSYSSTPEVDRIMKKYKAYLYSYGYEPGSVAPTHTSRDIIDTVGLKVKRKFLKNGKEVFERQYNYCS